MTGDLVIPSSVEYIGDDALSGLKSVSSITLSSAPIMGKTINSGNTCDISLALTDDSNVANISNYSGLTNVANKFRFKKYTRTISSTSSWGTLVVPFTLKSCDNYKLYVLSGANANALTFREVETVDPNTPCLFHRNGNSTTIEFSTDWEKYQLNNIEQTSASNITMKGTYAKKENQTGIYYISSNQFWKADNAVSINPFRAWFEGTLPSNAKSFAIFVEGDDETTGIGRIENGELKMENSGKYIENGQIVIVKNGKKYNTQGQMVK